MALSLLALAALIAVVLLLFGSWLNGDRTARGALPAVTTVLPTAS